jgi:hypothetical protein
VKVFRNKKEWVDGLYQTGHPCSIRIADIEGFAANPQDATCTDITTHNTTCTLKLTYQQVFKMVNA